MAQAIRSAAPATPPASAAERRPRLLRLIVFVVGAASLGAEISAARLLGANSIRLMGSLLIPLARRSLVVAAVLTFLHTMGEFGVVLMVGGNLQGITRTVSIDIYDHVQSLEYAAANRMALVLLAISFAVLSLVYAVNRRVGRQLGRRLWTPWIAR